MQDKLSFIAMMDRGETLLKIENDYHLDTGRAKRRVSVQKEEDTGHWITKRYVSVQKSREICICKLLGVHMPCWESAIFFAAVLNESART